MIVDIIHITVISYVIAIIVYLHESSILLLKPLPYELFSTTHHTLLMKINKSAPEHILCQPSAT